jgi:hypothetical protein
LVAQEHVNDPPFPSLSSYDGIPPNKTYQAAALINAARNTGGSISEVCCRRWNLRPVAILVNERPDGTQVSHGMLANPGPLRRPDAFAVARHSRLENRKPSSRKNVADGIAVGR